MPQSCRNPIVIVGVQVPMPAQFVEHGDVWGFFYRAGFKDFAVTHDKGYDIQTPEGVMHASPGDWIIRGSQGECYPVKPNIFETIYNAGVEAAAQMADEYAEAAERTEVQPYSYKTSKRKTSECIAQAIRTLRQPKES